MSLGGGSNKSSSSGTQYGQNYNYGSDVWGAQSPFLQDLYARSQASLGNAGRFDIGAEMYAGSAGDLNQRATQAIGQSNQYLSQFANPGTNPALQAYANNLGQQFREQFLPGLKGDAMVAGALGGSRQQIGAALGAQRAEQTLGDFTAQTYSDDQNRRLAAATAIGQNAGLYQQGAAQQLASGDFLRSIPWYGLQQYAGLLGSPTSIDKGGYGWTSGTNKSSGGGWNIMGGLGGG